MKLSAWCGRHSLVAEYIETVKSRIAWQIKPDGSMPEELARTKPWSYSVFCLSAFFVAATVASDFGEDLFSYRTAGGSDIRHSLDYLAGFAAGEKPWPYSELYDFTPDILAPLLYIGAVQYESDAYSALAMSFTEFEDHAARIFFD